MGGAFAKRKSPHEMLHRCHDKTLQNLKYLVQLLSHLPHGVPISKADRDDIKECVGFMDLQVRRHEEDEEKSVFPRLEAKHQDLIDQLTAEHRLQHQTMMRLKYSLDALFKQSGQPKMALDLAGQLLHLYTHHIEYENKYLLPLVEEWNNTLKSEAKQEMRERRE